MITTLPVSWFSRYWPSGDLSDCVIIIIIIRRLQTHYLFLFFAQCVLLAGSMWWYLSELMTLFFHICLCVERSIKIQKRKENYSNMATRGAVEELHQIKRQVWPKECYFLSLFPFGLQKGRKTEPEAWLSWFSITRRGRTLRLTNFIQILPTHKQKPNMIVFIALA